MGWISDIIINISAFRIKIGQKLIYLKNAIDLKANIDGSNIPPTTHWTNLHAGGLDGYVFHGSDVGSNFESVLVISQGAIFRTNKGGFRTWVGIGTLSDLTTTHKTTIVGAINEVNAKSNDFKIGGRNYQVNGRISSVNGFIWANAISSLAIENNNELRITGQNAGYLVFPYLSTPIPNDQIVTVSFKVKNNTNTTNTISTTFNGNGGPQNHHIAANAPWTTVSRTGRISDYTASNTLSFLFLENYNAGHFDVSIKEITVTIGNVPIDWAPAPEDQISDWNQTDNTQFDFIKNKPDLANLSVRSGDNWGNNYTNIFGGVSGTTGVDYLYAYKSSTGYGHILTINDFKSVLGLQSYALINGSNTTGGGWQIDYVFAPVLANSIGNTQVFYANGAGEIYWGNPEVIRHTIEMSAIDRLRVYVPGLGYGQVWHQFNFNPDNYLPKSYGTTSAIAAYYRNASIPPAGSRIKIRLPYAITSDVMIAFTIRVYQNYRHSDIAISGYFYSGPNIWYEPSARFIVSHGNAWQVPIDVIFGYDADGKAYVSIPMSNYIGIAVLDVVLGFAYGSNPGAGWEINPDNNTPNITTTRTIEPLNRLGQLTNDVGFITTAGSYNGQLTVNTTADLVGGYVYLPSGNVTTTLGLATHILNAIADGQAAYNWGNHATAGYTNLGAVQNWVATQGFLTASALNGYVLQSSLTAQLANYATLAGTQTFTGQITFNQAPIVPNGTLGGHTVNLGQMQNYVNNAIANISMPNGQLTFNVTSDFVGGFTYLPNGNITTTLGLATHVLNAIADGQTAYNWGNHATAGYLTLGALNGYATQNWVWTVINSLAIKTRQYDPTDPINNDYWDKIPIKSVRPDFGFDVCNYEPQTQEYVSIFSNYGAPYLNEGILGSIALMCPHTGMPVIKGTVECQINLNPYIDNNQIYFCLVYERDTSSPTYLTGSLQMLSIQDIVSHTGSGSVEMFNSIIVLGVATRDNTLMVQHREF